MSDNDTSNKDDQGTRLSAGKKNNPDAKSGSDSKKSSGNKTPDKKAPTKKTSTTGKTKDHAKSGQGPDNSSSKGSAKSQTSSITSYIISGILLVAILISMAGIFMLWQQQQAQKKEQQKNKQQQQAQSQLISSLESELKKYTQGQDQLRSEINNKVTSEINEIERSIAAIKKSGSKNVHDWVLSESEYLIRIANHRLQLEGDIKTAIKALRIADSRIKGLADPSLLPVRKQLADEISALGSTHLPDIHGMVLTLDSLQAMSPNMKLNISILPKAASEIIQENKSEELSIKDWKLVLDKVWNELKTLVVIKRHDQSLAPVLTVEQQQTIRHILQLKIQGIRTALLNKQSELFLESTKDTMNWLQEHFDTDDSSVALLKSRLQEFQSVQLDIKLPDIGGSLRSLHSIQKRIKDNTRSGASPKKPVNTSRIPVDQNEQVII